MKGKDKIADRCEAFSRGAFSTRAAPWKILIRPWASKKWMERSLKRPAIVYESARTEKNLLPLEGLIRHSRSRDSLRRPDRRELLVVVLAAGGICGGAGQEQQQQPGRAGGGSDGEEEGRRGHMRAWHRWRGQHRWTGPARSVPAPLGPPASYAWPGRSSSRSSEPAPPTAWCATVLTG